MDPSSSLVPLVVGDGSSSSASDDDEAAAGIMMNVVGGGDLQLRSTAARAITDNANRSSSQLTAQMIMQKGKYGVAMFITNELAREKLQLATTTTTTALASSAVPQQSMHMMMMMSSTTTTTTNSTTGNIAVTATSGGGTDVAAAVSAAQVASGGGGSTGGTAGRKQIPTDLHRSVGGTVPKQQYHPLDMTIGGGGGGGGSDVAKMDSVNVDDLEDSPFVVGVDSDEAFTGSHYLNLLLDDLLMPDKRINDPETIDWCKWLIAGGRIPEDFAQIGEWGLDFVSMWNLFFNPSDPNFVFLSLSLSSPWLRQQLQVWIGVDPTRGCVPLSDMRHLALHVHLPGVLQEGRPRDARFQHVLVASWGCL